MPAAVAAVTSPWLWPTTTSGSTPAARHSSHRPSDTAHRVGCSMSIRDSHSSPASPETTRTRSQSVYGSSAAAQRWITAANTGSAARSSRPMACHCEPWPGNTKAVRPTAAARPVNTPGTGSAPAGSAASRSSCPAAAAVSAASRAARTGNWSRCQARVPASAASRSGPGNCSGSGNCFVAGSVAPVSSSRSSRARSASACSECADTGSSTGARCSLSSEWPSAAGPSAATGVSGRGAPVSTTCALVPPQPKLLTPRKTCSSAGSGSGSRTTVTFSSSKAISGLSSAECRLGGTTPWRSASSALNSPGMPAAASRWPMLVFTEPIGSGPASALRVCPSTRPTAPASIGSPTEVPVPCAST